MDIRSFKLCSPRQGMTAASSQPQRHTDNTQRMQINWNELLLTHLETEARDKSPRAHPPFGISLCQPGWNLPEPLGPSSLSQPFFGAFQPFFCLNSPALLVYQHFVGAHTQHKAPKRVLVVHVPRNWIHQGPNQTFWSEEQTEAQNVPQELPTSCMQM